MIDINIDLFEAVKSGNVSEVEKALTQQRLNTATYYGAQSLFLATEQENYEILEVLLKSSEKVNRESFWRRVAYPTLREAQKRGNTQIIELLERYGAVLDKKRLAYEISETNESKSKIKQKDALFIIYSKEGKIENLKNLLELGVDEKTVLSGIDALLEKNNWKVADEFLDFCKEKDMEIYTECLKRLFLKSTYVKDNDRIKFYLEKIIENAVGVLTDEAGRSTLEIAVENGPSDIITVLSNYGFHENSLRHAYNCLENI